MPLLLYFATEIILEVVEVGWMKDLIRFCDNLLDQPLQRNG